MCWENDVISRPSKFDVNSVSKFPELGDAVDSDLAEAKSMLPASPSPGKLATLVTSISLNPSKNISET